MSYIPESSWGDTSTVEKTCNLVVDEVEKLKNYLMGRVLTVVDATYADREQRKAMKDVIKSAFYSEEFYSKNIVYLMYQFAKEDPKEFIEGMDNQIKPYVD